MIIIHCKRFFPIHYNGTCPLESVCNWKWMINATHTIFCRKHGYASHQRKSIPLFLKQYNIIKLLYKQISHIPQNNGIFCVPYILNNNAKLYVFNRKYTIVIIKSMHQLRKNPCVLRQLQCGQTDEPKP